MSVAKTITATSANPRSDSLRPRYIAAGFVALVLRNPTADSKLRARFMRSPEAYATVFSDDVPLEVWPAITDVVKSAGETLEKVRPRAPQRERFLAKSRNLLALLAVARCLGKFSYQIDELIALDKSRLTGDMLLETWRFVMDVRCSGLNKGGVQMPGWQPDCAAVANKFGLEGVEQVNRRNLFSLKKPLKLDATDEGFLESVNRMLPPQPWEPGIHQSGKATKCPKREDLLR